MQFVDVAKHGSAKLGEIFFGQENALMTPAQLHLQNWPNTDEACTLQIEETHVVV